MQRFLLSFLVMTTTMLLLAGCVFVPKSTLDQSTCEMYTPQWELSVEGVSDFNMCNGSGKDAAACLVTVGIVIPLGSMLVSGSVILAGNTIHWLEYHGRCDEGLIKKTLSKFKNETSS
jgi:hypothetical protein